MIFATADELIIKKDTIYGKPMKGTDKTTDEGQFVSLMLSESKPPFYTKLTIFSRRNGFCSLIIADDLRQDKKATSLIGIAIMLPAHNVTGYFYGKC